MAEMSPLRRRMIEDMTVRNALRRMETGLDQARAAIRQKLQAARIIASDETTILRNQAPGCAGTVFQAVKVALPPLFRRVNPDGTDPPPRPNPKKPRKRRLTPRRRSATPDSKIEKSSPDQ